MAQNDAKFEKKSTLLDIIENEGPAERKSTLHNTLQTLLVRLHLYISLHIENTVCDKHC